MSARVGARSAALRSAALRSAALRSAALLSAALLSTLLLAARPLRALELTPALPQTIHLGRPPGAAPLRGVDWARSRRGELPPGVDAQLLWQRRLPGALSANPVVDAAGRVFASAPGRVLQLGPDGRDEYARHAEFSAAVAVALLADGQRVVLGREGSVYSWSERGVPGFTLDLRVPQGWARGDLLSLPEGGALASLGAWLFRISAKGELEAYTQLSEPVAETLISAGQTWVVSERGDVLRWDGRSAPVKLGELGGRVSAVALRAPGQLLALVEGRELLAWSPAQTQRGVLAKLEGAGDAARISVPGAQRALVLGSNGTLTSLLLADSSGEATSASLRLAPGPGELVSYPDGTLAWLLPNTPLELQREGAEARSFPEVRCAQPASLLPAGSGRLLAACRSGQVWLIGPLAPAPTDKPQTTSGRPPQAS